MGKFKLLACASMMLLLSTFGSFGELAKITAYNWHERDSRPYGDLNCQGTKLEVGQCAADLRYHHLGEVVHVDGMGTYVVSDCGSAIVGRNRFDIYVSTLQACNEFGVQYRNVSYAGDNEEKQQPIVRKHIMEHKQVSVSYNRSTYESAPRVYSSKALSLKVRSTDRDGRLLASNS